MGNLPNNYFICGRLEADLRFHERDGLTAFELAGYSWFAFPPSHPGAPNRPGTTITATGFRPNDDGAHRGSAALRKFLQQRWSSCGWRMPRTPSAYPLAAPRPFSSAAAAAGWRGRCRRRRGAARRCGFRARRHAIAPPTQRASVAGGRPPRDRPGRPGTATVTSAGRPRPASASTRSHRRHTAPLPLQSLVKVTNLNNGRSVVVTINDRGPVSPRLPIDVSPRAADELNMRTDGIVPVAIEQVAVARTQ